MIRTTIRRALVLGSVLMVAMPVAQPAAATTPISSSGTFGLAIIKDSHHGKQGANCDYKTTKSNGVYPLKGISVRGPRLWAEDTGSGTQHQWVGWKYKIQRDTNFDQVYSTKFESSTVKEEATDQTPVQFSRRTWTASSNLAVGNYRVKVTLLWYEHGSTTDVRGKQVVLYDWYQAKGGGFDRVVQYHCYSSNNDPH